ncbi:hypothetical protein EVJ58_g251 [Rhodofomes roseus]|uniref:MYND-type domain-containing protein n=1 Tax=Rhodofomes roseus TaxID=34475 RepID=A0A4Y9Z4Z5_9APHY|nr:hypothetical protein EVJ58_g251 [Rhodofomes roseus]
MDSLTRQETLTILAGMGVELPPATKLPDEALQKRLRQALNGAQYVSNVLANSPLDLATLSAWPLAHSVYEGVRRGNLQEAQHNYQAKLQGRETELYKNPILDARQTLMGIAKWWDEEHRWMVLQDPESEQCAINIRLLSVLELDKDTPVIVLLYQSVTRADVMEGLQWLNQMRDKNGSPGYLVNIKCTPLEQKLLLRLLAINAKLLTSTYVPKKESSEKNFKVSFLLPLGPLSFEDVGKLNNDPGCVLCGRKTTSRCSQCQSVAYCGSDCQKADWSHHKRVCRSLNGGTWRSARFTTVLPGMEGMYAVPLNRHSSRATNAMNTPRQLDSSVLQPNPHGSRLFLVKLQASLGGTPSSIMVYDRQRSIDVYIHDPEVFDDMLREMRGPRGGYGGVKMYRWAKRISDWELSICMDKEPQTEIKW